MSQSRSNARFADLCAAFDARMRERRIPGAALGILHEGAVHYAGFGVTSLEHPLPVTPDTLFQCGSISKTVLGTAAMRLVEEGVLSLDAPIRRYVPAFKLRDEAAAASVTLRHLLTHTGGWLGDHFNDFGYGEDAIAKVVDELASLPQWTPLGAHWSYNNIGFAVAALAMQAAAGQSYEDIVRTRVFEPLGLTNTFFFPTEVMTRRFALGHNVVGGQVATARPWEIGRASHPAGGVNTCVVDLLRYAQCHIGDGAPILSPKSARAMRSAQVSATGRYDMGLTWWLGPLESLEKPYLSDKTVFVQHGGATNGFTAHLRVVPARRFAIVVLTNSDDGPSLYDPISLQALQSFLGLTLDTVRPRKTPAAQLKAYAGRYVAHLTERQLRVENGALMLQTTNLGRFPTPTSPVHGDALDAPVEIALYARDCAFAKSDGVLGARGEFLRDARGKVEWLRWGGRLHRKVS